MLRFSPTRRLCRVATPLLGVLRHAHDPCCAGLLSTRRARIGVGSSSLSNGGGLSPLQCSRRGLFAFGKNKERTPRAPLETEEDGEGLVIGNVKAGIRSNALTAYERSDFLGHLFPLARPRADAGDVLALIDTSAGHAAYTHMSGHVYGGRFVLGNSRISMATVAFNAFMFSKPVFQGDLIQVNTRVIHAGSSSIGVYVHVQRQAFDCPVLETVGHSYVTMVIVDAKSLRVAPGYVPAVRLTDPSDSEHRHEYLEWREEARVLSQLNRERSLTKAEVEHPENQKKKQWLKPEECICRMDRSFGVGDVNVNKAIFGGEMLRFMERCALHCGRVFARQARLFTLGMMDMTFDGPLFIHDLARCKAQVTCVRRSTLLVNVRVIALDANGEERSTNRASFVLVAIDTEGKPFEIENGIDLTDASQHDLHKYWEGRRLMRASHLRRKRRADRGAEDDKVL